MSLSFLRIACVVCLNAFLVSSIPLQPQPLLRANIQHWRDLLQLSKDHSRTDNDQPTESAPMKPCCYPKKWQGVIYQYMESNFVSKVDWYEDDANKTIAANYSVMEEGKVVYQYMQITTYDTKLATMVIYTFETLSKLCNFATVANTFDELAQQCMPKDAQYLGMHTMGIANGGANFGVHSFAYEAGYERTVTADCAPVIVTQRADEWLEADFYYEIQTSITDPSVFTIPDYCKPSTTPQSRSAESFSVGSYGGIRNLNQRLKRTALGLP